MGILVRIRLAKLRTMARQNSPDMSSKRIKKARLGLKIVSFLVDNLLYMLGLPSF